MNKGLCEDCDHLGRSTGTAPNWLCRQGAECNHVTVEWAIESMTRCVGKNGSGECENFYDKRLADAARSQRGL